MKLTTRSEYGLLALLYLARQERGKSHSVEQIAQAQKIPARFLEQLMLPLKRAGYVRGTRGARGGYCLSREAKSITLAEVIRLFDGALAPTTCVSRYFYEPTPIEREKRLVAFFEEVHARLLKSLEGTTLDKIL